MPGKPVEFHPEAFEDAAAAFGWYCERSDTAAAGFLRELEHGVAAIAEAPQRWPPGAAGTRRFLLKRFPLSLVYREQATSIQIIAVAHGRRRPGYWKHRSA
jgi:plasmid stabilization system protein ParE